MIGQRPRLELRQTQRLAMTPQLRQAIQILQMTNQELDRFVEAEMERNPLLHRAGDAPRGVLRRDAPDRPLMDAAAAEPSPALALREIDAPAGAMAEPEAAPRPEAPPGLPPGGGGGGFAEAAAGRPWGDAPPSLEETLAAAVSLLDHVADQLRLMRAPAPRRALAMAFAAELDPNGWLADDPLQIAARLGADAQDAAPALALLQACEPAGLGARGLAECLSLQLAARDRLDPAMQALLAHLPLLAKADRRALRRVCGVDDEDLTDMIAEIRALDPRPGRVFTAPAALAVAPDVLVTAAPEGGWRVELNEATLPRLLVSNVYAAHVSADREARRFVSDCAQSGAFLLRSLDQRARTILRVATEVVRRQQGFFEQGVAALRPMTLRQVADEIGVHESTVSRVAAGKHLACPRGTFELRWFFTQAIAAVDGGEAHSAAAIRARLRGLIEGEDARRTLSDDALVTLLKADGVDIARRTVAKYREGMNIPSSVQRRRLKAQAS
ncbi:MAG: RNA polymerase factor sigma-54 [Pseudomonadota bacterium]